MRRPASQVLALALALVALGCDTEEFRRPGGDPGGDRAFHGAFEIAGLAETGTCTVIVPPPRAEGAARARCVSPASLVELAGTYTPEPSDRGTGTVSLEGASAGLVWHLAAAFTRTPASGQTTGIGGPLVLEGPLTLRAGASSEVGRVVTVESTVAPVTAYCGSIVSASGARAPLALATDETTAFAVADAADGAAVLRAGGFRDGAALTLYDPATGAAVATAIFGAAGVAGAFPALGAEAPTATFSGERCGASAAHVCCGFGEETRCCFEAACPCP
jgi:hypothetical protein